MQHAHPLTIGTLDTHSYAGKLLLRCQASVGQRSYTFASMRVRRSAMQPALLTCSIRRPHTSSLPDYPGSKKARIRQYEGKMQYHLAGILNTRSYVERILLRYQVTMGRGNHAFASIRVR
jgi:hypothetical protein